MQKPHIAVQLLRGSVGDEPSPTTTFWKLSLGRPVTHLWWAQGHAWACGETALAELANHSYLMQCAKLTSPKRKPTIFHVKINLLVCRNLVRILQWQITKTQLIKKKKKKPRTNRILRILGSRSHSPQHCVWAIHETTGQKKHIWLSTLFLIYTCLSLHRHPQPQQETTALIFQGEHHAGTRHPQPPSKHRQRRGSPRGANKRHARGAAGPPRPPTAPRHPQPAAGGCDCRTAGAQGSETASRSRNQNK